MQGTRKLMAVAHYAYIGVYLRLALTRDHETRLRNFEDFLAGGEQAISLKRRERRNQVPQGQPHWFSFTGF